MKLTQLPTSTPIALFALLVLVGTLLIGSAVGAAEHQDSDSHHFTTELSGSSEVPSVETDTTGSATLSINEAMDEAAFAVDVADGQAITAAHLHCAPAGENGPVFAFLFGNIPGGFDVDGTLAAFTLTDANILPVGADCASSITDIASLKAAIEANEVYVNVHSVAHPSGEVRGQLAMMENDNESDTDEADQNDDGFISVAEGVPFYGAIVTSLTTTGDMSPDSALALTRFPAASSTGSYEYVRTFMLADSIENLENVHIVVHGEDIDGSGSYDGEKESSIAEGVPFEATVPVACGEVTATPLGYSATLTELNSTGAYGEANLTVQNGEVTLTMEVEGVSPNLAHAQHFHLGGSNVCPPNTEGIEGADEEEDEENSEEEENEEEDNENGNNLPGVTLDDLNEEITRKVQTQIEETQSRIDERLEAVHMRIRDLF